MQSEYTLRESEKKDAPSIVAFLNEHYAQEAVITQAYISKNRHRMTDKERTNMKKSMKDFLETYPSLLVTHKESDEIVAVIVLYPSDDDKRHAKACRKAHLLEELDELLVKVNEELGFYEKFKDKKILKVRNMAVHKNHRGKGLAKVLLKKSIEWAEKEGYDLIYSLFTFAASAGAGKSVGFRKFADYDLNTMKNSKGEIALDDTSPNNITSLLFKILEK